MATLTAGELLDIRYVIGDDLAAAGEQELTDVMIQAQYDQAAKDVPSADLLLPYTYVYCLRRMWGRMRRKVDRVTDNQNRESFSQLSEHAKELLDYWEDKAGLAGRNLTAGLISLGLDEVDPA